MLKMSSDANSGNDQLSVWEKGGEMVSPNLTCRSAFHRVLNEDFDYRRKEETTRKSTARLLVSFCCVLWLCWLSRFSRVSLALVYLLGHELVSFVG
jgi:hypothetical protein